MKRLINISIVFLVVLVGFCVLSSAQYQQPTTTRSLRYSRSRARPSSLQTIQLSEPNLAGQLSLESALAQRRSVREFSQQKLTFSQIGQLAWAGQGITDQTKELRASPSAGALYPLTLYIATEEGLFTYVPEDHSLQQSLDTDIRGRLSAAALNQNAVADAPCDIIIAGSVRKLMPRYQNNSRRFMILEAGHVAQNILLQTVSLNLASVPIGAFNLSRVNDLCRMNRDMEPLYIIAVGHPQTETKQSTTRQPISERAKKIDQERPKVAVIIAPRMNYNDNELSVAQRALTDLGVITNIASTKKGSITGTAGSRSRAEMLLTDIDLNSVDGLVFIGGLGITEYAFDPYVSRLVSNAVSRGKIVGALSNAATILANAGVINGYKVTGLPTQQTFLERAGAQYTGTMVERDGQIITAMNPQAARQFGTTFGQTLNQLYGGSTQSDRVRIRSGPIINYTYPGTGLGIRGR